jgi:glutaconyl-CoA decarboxylase
VLEAMKMQNEIASNMDGVVREIRVSEGDLVESGDVLVVIGS